jgi:arabinan endo-1,5-alpha-L-arabinosidase
MSRNKLRHRADMRLLLVVFGLGFAPAWGQVPSPAASPEGPALPSLAQMGKRNARVHDPSTIVGCKDQYWLFATGTGIVSWHSKDLAQWEKGPAVFPVLPAWRTNIIAGHRGHFWAPEIICLNRRYLLYYSVSAWGKNMSAIALAANRTLDPGDPAYRWGDEGIVIASRAGDNFNAIDPSVLLDDDGRLWMAFGSFWSGIKLVELDPASGRRLASDSPVHSLAYHDSIEAAYLHRRGGYYYLFVNWGFCSRGVDSTYNIRVGRSRSISGPYLDRNGVDMLRDGGSLFLGTTGQFIGPGQVGIFSAGGANWLSCHFYDGSQGGTATLAIMPLNWSADDWPAVSGTAANTRRARRGLS